MDAVVNYKKHEPFFGSWYIARMLGEGAFGKVFEIEREDFGTTYKAALKIITVPQNESDIKDVMLSGMDNDSVTEFFEDMVKGIVSEFELMSKLKGNSNIVSYEDHQVIPFKDKKIGWDILIRMELLTPLLDYAQNSILTRKDVMKLGIDICSGLELCQKHNIIHRDIKPENIFISDSGSFKLGDFGIARTIEKTSSGLSKKGTYTYMAPEVYKGESYGSDVDIYSLGIVMYRLLNNNRTPFLPPYPEKIKHSDIDNALAQRISGTALPEPANADGRLAEIVLKACAYNPKERYSSPMQMRQELEVIVYDTSKSGMIYPKGDNVTVSPNEYEKSETGDDEANSEDYFENDGTVSIFGGAAPRASGRKDHVQVAPTKFCLRCGVPIPANVIICLQCDEEPKSKQKSNPVQNKDSNSCIKCAEPILNNKSFCIRCGTKNEQVDKPKIKILKFCMKCGESLLAGKSFCIKCGTKAGQVPTSTEDIATKGNNLSQSAETAGEPQSVIEKEKQLYKLMICIYCGGKRSDADGNYGECDTCGKGNSWLCYICGGTFSKITGNCKNKNCSNSYYDCMHCKARGMLGVCEKSGICNTCGRPYKY